MSTAATAIVTAEIALAVLCTFVISKTLPDSLATVRCLPAAAAALTRLGYEADMSDEPTQPPNPAGAAAPGVTRRRLLT
ncbi:hypothetical protein, partial [Mycobacterium avium]|uniref:hypothetical protein n=1 Tax=Mycobacterium avium TaxID=1764 RepID=UPI001F34B515